MKQYKVIHLPNQPSTEMLRYAVVDDVEGTNISEIHCYCSSRQFAQRIANALNHMETLC